MPVAASEFVIAKTAVHDVTTTTTTEEVVACSGIKKVVCPGLPVGTLRTQ